MAEARNYGDLEKRADEIIEKLTDIDSLSINANPDNVKAYKEDIELLENAALKDGVPTTLRLKAEKLWREYIRAVRHSGVPDDAHIWNMSCPNNCGSVQVYAAKNGVLYAVCSRTTAGSVEKNINCVVLRLCEQSHL